MKTKFLFCLTAFAASGLSEATILTADSINCGWDNQIADGSNSIILGDQNSVSSRAFALGWNNSATNSGLALGLSNVAANYSIAAGNSNYQSGDSFYSLATGHGNIIEGASQYSSVLGYHNILQGQDGSFIAGIENKMLFPSTKDGLGNVILGEYNALDLTAASGTHARSTVLIGYENNSSASKAYAIGVGNIGQQETVTLGTYAATVSNASLIVGTGTGSGNRSNGLVVLRDGTVQVPSGVLKVGSENVLTNTSVVPQISSYLSANNYLQGNGINVAVGENSSVNGFLATALGADSYATWAATALGASSSASGYYAAALGAYTTAGTYQEVVAGAFNVLSIGSAESWVPTESQFVVGNGVSESERSNAITTLKNGRTSLINKYWNAANPTAVPVNASDASNGEALSVEGHAVIQGNTTLKGNTVLEGKVTLAQPQGDISMGVYGN